MIKLRSLAVGTGLVVSSIITHGSFVPVQAVGLLLTTEVGYTGPGLNLSPFANGNYNFTSGPVSIPGGITFTSTNSNSVLGQGVYGIVGFAGFDGNGFIDTPAVYAGLNSGNGYMTFSFATPVSSFGAFLNYAPTAGLAGVPSATWDRPTISTYNSLGNLLSTFDLSAVAPIATPGSSGSLVPVNPLVNQFQFRGINEGTAVISSFRLGGSRIVATGTPNGVYPGTPPTGVPEPLTVIGTILGGTAAFRIRKKLQSKL